jgi:rare lipoprotein A
MVRQSCRPDRATGIEFADIQDGALRPAFAPGGQATQRIDISLNSVGTVSPDATRRRFFDAIKSQGENNVMKPTATVTGKAGGPLTGKAGVRTSPRKESSKFSEVMAGLEKPRAGAAAEKAPSPAPVSGADPGQPIEYTVKPGDSLWKIGRKLFNRDPYQIARDNGLADPNLIRPGQKLIINPAPAPAEPVKVSGEVTASWYGAEHHNKVTASGQRFDMNGNTLAHRTLPLGTKVRLVNPDNGKSAEGVVTDRGPFVKGRDVDVSYAMAKKLGFVRKGITKLDIETI